MADINDVAMQLLIDENKALKSRVTELECFADKVVNWDEILNLTQRLDMGSNGQKLYFISLAAKVLKNEASK